MFISPKTAIDNGWVSYVGEGGDLDDWSKYIGPNALDFTLDRVYTIDSQKHFYISEEKKQMRGGKELIAEYDPQRQEHYWKLDAGVYDGMSNFYVKIPEGVAAMLVVRSSFNRNGINIFSGLFDQFFSGNIGHSIHNRSGLAFIAPGTRIGQLIFVKSESSGILYAGGYNTEKGQHWSEI